MKNNLEIYPLMKKALTRFSSINATQSLGIDPVVIEAIEDRVERCYKLDAQWGSGAFWAATSMALSFLIGYLIGRS